MTQPNDSSVHSTPVQPSLSRLLSRYLQQQAEAHASGLGVVDAGGEVQPFDAGPVQPIDPRPAWEGVVAAARCLCPAVEARSWQTPPQWASLVAAHEPAAALAFSMGNFPQLVRNLHLLMQQADLSSLRPTGGRPVGASGLAEWARQLARKEQYPQTLLAIGTLRLAREFDRAAELLREQEEGTPAEWRAALANEKAALAWHRGDAAEARALWQALPASTPVLFNRGMSALFSNDAPQARAALGEAVARLPEAGPWHHLGRLYLALAEMRS
jgi:tetratricopeptide (TPR) repeat protein